jgi:hypothetical protein
MIKKIIYSFIVLLIFTGCGDSELDPALNQNKDADTGIQTAGDVESVVLGMYNRMTNYRYYGRNLIAMNEVRTDNVFPNANSGRFLTDGQFAYTASNGNATDLWTYCYRVIANANIIIAQKPDAFGTDAGKVKHMQGQAYFVRALAHFDLLKQFGQMHSGGTLGVPYVKEYKGENASPARLTVEQTKTEIIKDLNTAFDLMNANKSFDGNSSRVSTFAPKALLSRVYLYFKMWTEAKAAAKAVMDSGKFKIIEAADYVKSFEVDNAANSIFELAYSDTDNEDSNSLGFIYKGDSYGDLEVLDNVKALYETTDVRKNILGLEKGLLRNLGKYPQISGHDNVPLIRYEEVVLNYAEALFRLVDANALTELNKLTAKRGATAYTSISEDIILKERRKELVFEGFRWDDLMRTGKNIEKVDAKQVFKSTINYGDNRLALPIPQAELDANSNMVKNPGY